MAHDYDSRAAIPGNRIALPASGGVLGFERNGLTYYAKAGATTTVGTCPAYSTLPPGLRFVLDNSNGSGTMAITPGSGTPFVVGPGDVYRCGVEAGGVLRSSLAGSENQRLDYAVMLRKPDGRFATFGHGASSDAARGQAIVVALAAWVDGGRILLGPGTFAIPNQPGATIATINNAHITLEGSGVGITVISASETLLNITGSSVVRIANLTIASSALITSQFDGAATLTNASATASSPVDSSDGSGVIDWYGGIVESPSGFAFDPTGCTTRYHDMRISSPSECFDTTGAPSEVELHNCTLRSTGAGVAAILNAGTFRIFGGSIASHATGLDINNGGTLEVSTSTVYDRSKTSGTITRLGPRFGSAYTTSNVTTDRTVNANATTTDELADVLGTLIADLQVAGIISLERLDVLTRHSRAGLTNH